MKVINDLIGYKDKKIVQDTDWFMFSLDSILLPRFVTINKNIKNILDIGTGNAPIPVILSTRTKAKIYGIEIQKDLYDLATETIKLNKLSHQISLINDDVKNIGKYFQYGFFDVILTNPPFFKVYEETKKNEDIHKVIARHEVSLNLEEIVAIASKYLKTGGIFAMVHRTERLMDILRSFNNNNIEPKKIQFIYPKKGTNSNIVLVEGRYRGNAGLKILPPIIAHKNDGSYSDDILKYFKEENNESKEL